MKSEARVGISGELGLEVVRRPRVGLQAAGSPGLRQPTIREIIRLGFPRFGLEEEVNDWRARNMPTLLRGMREARAAMRGRAPTLLGVLHLAKILRDGRRLELGLASLEVVTTAYVNFLVDGLHGGVADVSNHNFHGIGTGTTAAAVGDTDLETELTTQYSTDNTRATGSQTEGAANVYRSVGTNQVDASVAITEHGIFDNATVGSGTLMDRHVFSVINLASGESLQSTFDLTVAAGG